jgi:predicted RNA methylase
VPSALERALGLLREVRAAALPADDDARRLHACALCARAVDAYWRAACAPHGELGGVAPCPVAAPAVDGADAARAAALGEAAAALPPTVAAYLLGTAYTALLPPAHRSRHGVFFTPPPLVDRLLDLVEEAGHDWTAGAVLDPACGGGAFLAPVAARMAAALERGGVPPAEIVRDVAARLAGVEIDPFSAWMARVFMEAALWPHCVAARLRVPPEVVEVRDALGVPDGWRGGFALVVGNPPYGRVTLDPEARARFGRSLFGHANLYGLFTDLAVRLLAPGGRVGYVTPTSFLGGLYFANLRRLLAAQAPPAAVDFVADRGGVFDDVLQETLLVVFAAGGATAGAPVHAIRPTALDRPCEVLPAGCFPAPDARGGPWILPRSPGQAALLAAVRRLGHALRDLGVRVSTGPLVWNRHKAQLRDAAGPGAYPLVWAESVAGPGVFAFSARRRNHTPFFAPEPGQGHLLTAVPCVLVQRTTAKEQQRRLVAAELPASFLAEHGAAVVENHLNVVRLAPESPLGLATLAALLNSRVADDVFRCISGSVAVSAYELEALPVPPPDALRELDARVRAGCGAAEAERLVAAAYGVDLPDAR